MKGSSRAPDLLRLHLAVAGFGFAGVLGKLVGLSPVVIVAGRAGFAALAIAAVHLLTGRVRELRPRAGDLPGLALGALLAVHWVTFFQSVQLAGVGPALVSFSISPILLLAMESLGRRRWPGARPALASLVALAGIWVLVPAFRWSDASLRGMAWGLASGFTYALLVLANRPLVRARGSSWILAMGQNAVALLVLIPFLAVPPGHPSPGEWALLALLGVGFTAATHGLFLQSIRTVPAHLAVLTCTLEPGYGMVAAAFVLGERPAPRTLLGAALIAGAVLAATLAGPGKESLAGRSQQ